VGWDSKEDCGLGTEKWELTWRTDMSGGHANQTIQVLHITPRTATNPFTMKKSSSRMRKIVHIHIHITTHSNTNTNSNININIHIHINTLTHINTHLRI
jgi:hypothetical protein